MADNRKYVGLLSQEKRTYNRFSQFKFAKSDLKILGASKLGSADL